VCICVFNKGREHLAIASGNILFLCTTQIPQSGKESQIYLAHDGDVRHDDFEVWQAIHHRRPTVKLQEQAHTHTRESWSLIIVEDCKANAQHSTAPSA